MKEFQNLIRAHMNVTRARNILANAARGDTVLVRDARYTWTREGER